MWQKLIGLNPLFFKCMNLSKLCTKIHNTKHLWWLHTLIYSHPFMSTGIQAFVYKHTIRNMLFFSLFITLFCVMAPILYIFKFQSATCLGILMPTVNTNNSRCLPSKVSPCYTFRILKKRTWTLQCVWQPNICRLAQISQKQSTFLGVAERG